MALAVSSFEQVDQASLNQGNPEAINFETLFDLLPVAVMTCRVDDFRIDYANPESKRLLRSIEHLLKITADEIIGTSIDIFHKRPDYQRGLLSDAGNMPHNARITLGEEILDLEIHAIIDTDGGYRRAMLVWNVVTDKVNAEAEQQRLLDMIDKMPINVMSCDLVDYRINYINNTSIETLRRIEDHLPVKADEMIGTSIDVFHKDPSHQRQLLANPDNLPWKALISVGPEKLKLNVSAVRGADDTYQGAMITWAIVTDNIKMADRVSHVVDSMKETASTMDETAVQMVDTVQETKSMAGSVAAASNQLFASIQEIAGQITIAADQANRARTETDKTNELVTELAAAAAKIGDVTALIKGIAEKTNLLALNATIEAARAGEAGRGFAVVAAEVKSLSKQTAQATHEIHSQIEDMRRSVDSSVTSIKDIGTIIQSLDEIAAGVAGAIEEQTAAANEVSRIIGSVEVAADKSESAAAAVRSVAGSLSDRSGELKASVDVYVDSVGV